MDPTFQYAGATRIPPKQFQLRSRIEHNTKDMINLNTYKHIETDVPDLTNNYPQLVDVKGRVNQIVDNSFDVAGGYKAPNYKVVNIPYQDMAPQNTRYDARDYKQAQPYVAGGPDLGLNPYFDRYDPVSDPRNAVRELRSAVYEDKGGDHGYDESQKKLRRQFEHRWLPEELITDDLMDTFLRHETITSELTSDNPLSVTQISKNIFNPDTYKSCDILDPIAKLKTIKPTVTMKTQIEQLLQSQKKKDEEDKKSFEKYVDHVSKMEKIVAKQKEEVIESLNKYETGFLIEEEEKKPIIQIVETKPKQEKKDEKKTSDLTIYPEAKSVKFQNSFLNLDSHKTKIHFDEEKIGPEAKILIEQLQNLTGISIVNDSNLEATIIELKIDENDSNFQDSKLKKQFYKYKILIKNTEPQILITAGSIIGLKNGIITLLQQIRSDSAGDARIQIGVIEDYMNEPNEINEIERFSKTAYLRNKYNTIQNGVKLIEDGLKVNEYNFSNRLSISFTKNRDDIFVYYSVNENSELKQYSEPIIFNGDDNHDTINFKYQVLDASNKPLGTTVFRKYKCVPYRIVATPNSVFFNDYAIDGEVRFDFNTLTETSKILPKGNIVKFSQANSSIYFGLFDSKTKKLFGSIFVLHLQNKAMTTLTYTISKVQPILIEKLYKVSDKIEPIQSILPFSTDYINIEAIIVAGGSTSSNGGMAKIRYESVPTYVSLDLTVGMPSENSSLYFKNNIDNKLTPTIAYSSPQSISNGEQLTTPYGYNYNNIPYGAPGFQGCIILIFTNN